MNTVTSEIELLSHKLEGLDNVDPVGLHFSPEEVFVYHQVKNNKALAHNKSTLMVLKSVVAKATK